VQLSAQHIEDKFETKESISSSFLFLILYFLFGGEESKSPLVFKEDISTESLEICEKDD